MSLGFSVVVGFFLILMLLVVGVSSASTKTRAKKAKKAMDAGKYDVSCKLLLKSVKSNNVDYEKLPPILSQLDSVYRLAGVEKSQYEETFKKLQEYSRVSHKLYNSDPKQWGKNIDDANKLTLSLPII